MKNNRQSRGKNISSQIDGGPSTALNNKNNAFLSVLGRYNEPGGSGGGNSAQGW
jgi:hypothetical protein